MVVLIFGQKVSVWRACCVKAGRKAAMKRNPLTLLWVLAAGMFGWHAMTANAAGKAGGHCQILDYQSDPLYHVGVAYVPPSTFEGHGKTAFIEPEADWKFAYFRDVAHADVDLNLRMRSVVFPETADIHLPQQVAKVAVDAGFTWRLEGGTALQLRTSPGFYSDFKKLNADGFYVPLSVALIHSFDPAFSGIVGFEARPDFMREVMPLVGVAWEISDVFRLEAMLPDSRLTCFMSRKLDAHVGFEWRSMTYTLNDEYNRKQMELEDFRTFLGITYRVSDQLVISGDMGNIFSRMVGFRDAYRGIGHELDIDSANWFRIVIGGPF